MHDYCKLFCLNLDVKCVANKNYQLCKNTPQIAYNNLVKRYYLKCTYTIPVQAFVIR